jgi:hypothetical protein
MKYRHEMTVAGRGPFPLDMLRFDGCWPKTGGDVFSISSSITRDSQEYRVTVMKFTDAKATDTTFTVGRWNSFGAGCTPITTEKISR